MTAVKLTKNELRSQQLKLAQLRKYLPTLQLKKAMLQAQVHEAKQEIRDLEKAMNDTAEQCKKAAAVFAEYARIDFVAAARPSAIEKRYENVAGVEIPVFEKVEYAAQSYDLIDSPAWVDSAIAIVQSLRTAKVKVDIGKEKLHALENELRDVSIRVNLFEKILIPRAQGNIKKIKVFLGDLQLSAVAQAKVAKDKIEKAKQVCK